MSYERRSAARYRAHAEELRTIADLDRLEETRRMLVKVADDYDRMALDMEGIAEMHESLQRYGTTGEAAPAGRNRGTTH